MKILLIGATGTIGHKVKQDLTDAHEVISVGFKEVLCHCKDILISMTSPHADWDVSDQELGGWGTEPDPAVAHTYIAQPIDLHCYSKKVLITNQVTTHFFDTQIESISYTLDARPTAGARLNGYAEAIHADRFYRFGAALLTGL